MKGHTRLITATAIGIALCTVVSLILRVPVFGRFYLCLGYLIMAIYSYYLGVLSGTLVGTLGIFFYCMITGSIGGMIGWALGNVVIGVCVGLVSRATRGLQHEIVRQLLLIGTGIISTAVGMLLVKSAYESLLSGLPFTVRVLANTAGFASDAFLLSLGFPLARVIKRILPKWFTDPGSIKGN